MLEFNSCRISLACSCNSEHGTIVYRQWLLTHLRVYAITHLLFTSCNQSPKGNLGETLSVWRHFSPYMKNLSNFLTLFHRCLRADALDTKNKSNRQHFITGSSLTAGPGNKMHLFCFDSSECTSTKLLLCYVNTTILGASIKRKQLGQVRKDQSIKTFNAEVTLPVLTVMQQVL